MLKNDVLNDAVLDNDGLKGSGNVSLSRRECEVLQLVAQALSNRQIAGALVISEATVKRHLYNAFLKLGASSRLDAVNKAVSASLIRSAVS
ncbi:response regulator transcription factor [Streptomyces litchfieldiae]|uniref:response regulator transcription factor n=1 Tax=Streptomyces litchfieldiae TaxID=3075543 RepID=UPI00374E051B